MKWFVPPTIILSEDPGASSYTPAGAHNVAYWLSKYPQENDTSFVQITGSKYYRLQHEMFPLWPIFCKSFAMQIRIISAMSAYCFPTIFDGWADIDNGWEKWISAQPRTYTRTLNLQIQDTMCWDLAYINDRTRSLSFYFGGTMKVSKYLYVLDAIPLATIVKNNMPQQHIRMGTNFFLQYRTSLSCYYSAFSAPIPTMFTTMNFRKPSGVTGAVTACITEYNKILAYIPAATNNETGWWSFWPTFIKTDGITSFSDTEMKIKISDETGRI